MSKMFQVYGLGQALIPVLPPPLPFQNPPTSNQTNYEIGQVVYTPSPLPTSFYIYAGAGNWINFTASLSTLTGNSGGAISPTSGNINIVGSGSVSVAGAGSTLTISAVIPPSFTWVSPATTTTMLTNHGYLVRSGAQQTFTLPTTSAVGDVLEIIWVSGAGGWQIAQTANQQVRGGASITTLGNAGTVTSTGIGSAIHLVCTAVNTLWIMDFSVLNFTWV